MPFAPSFDRLEFTDRSAMDLLIYALLAWCAIDVRGEKLTTMDLKRAIQREGVVNAAKAHGFSKIVIVMVYPPIFFDRNGFQCDFSGDLHWGSISSVGWEIRTADHWGAKSARRS